MTTIVFEALHPEQFEASSIEATTTTEPSTGSSLKKDESVEITADGEQHFTTTTSTTNEAVVDEILDQLVDAIIEEEETLQSEGGEPSNQLNDFVDQLITELEERSEEGAEVHVDLTNLRDEDGNSLIEEEGVYDEDDEEYDDDKQDGDNSTGEEEVIGDNGQHLG